ncbi:MAG TPA: acyltransferase [Candidatus Sulfotelmatobacter sp.]|nr:acyltransferase [Candidatus Sulfotelmatobacter sp.]
MTARRIPSLDGLRAISITLVILSHLVKWKHVSLDRLGSYGALGVFVFFVLSGYLITSLLLREHERTSTVSLRDFYVRRAFRIFPAALVFLAIVIALYWRQMTWYHIAAALLYVANMDPSRPWIFGHLWSLSIEEQFYLLWPFALRNWYRKRVAMLVGVLLFQPLFLVALHAFKVQNGLLASLPVYAGQLGIGCLLAILAPRLPKISGSLALIMLVAVVFIPWFAATNRLRTLFSLFVLSPLLHVSIAGLVLHVIQVPYRFLNWAPIVWLGRISYSLYLWQELFCSNASLHSGYLLVLPSLACAAVSYYLVEQPMLHLRDLWSRKSAHPILSFAPLQDPLITTQQIADQESEGLASSA